MNIYELLEEAFESARTFGVWLFTEATPLETITLLVYVVAMRILCRVLAPVGKRCNFFLEELTYFIQENIDYCLNYWIESMYKRITKRN